MNSEQRKHLAQSLQTIALGQLAYFGYTGLAQPERVAITIAVYVLLDGLALFVLKGEI
jgi:hypothetical protein